MSRLLHDQAPRACLTEEVDVKARLREDVGEFSLDPDVYVAVVEAELVRSGIVNRNGRVYPAPEFVRENASLANRLSDEFVDGELGHPEMGPTFDVPARLIEVTLKRDSDNVVTAEGRFGLLNTAAGSDVLTLFRAGMPVGVSSRGEGVLEQVVVEEGTQLAADNPGYVGRSVGLVSDFRLDRYDLVRVPSAGTHLQRETSSSQHSEAAPIGEVTMSDQEKTVATEAAQEVQPKEQAEMNDAAQILESDPLYGLTDTQKGVLLRIVEGITVAEAETPNDDQIACEIAALREQMVIDRERATINEAEYSALKEEVAALRKEREERVLADALESAKVEATANKRFGDLVAEQLSTLISEGMIAGAGDVATHAQRLFGLLEAVTEPVVQPVEQAPVDASEQVSEAVAQEVTEEAVEVDNNIYKSLRDLMAHDRRTYGG